MKTRSLAVAVLATAVPGALFAAFAVGGAVYTKRPDTPLLKEPKPLAESVAKLPYAQSLKIEKIQGPWLHVSDGKNAGWIFAGNLAEEKPSEVRGLDGLPVAAAETTATAAARPLVPAAEEYSSRRGLTKASDDLTWLNQQQGKITPADVTAFLQEKKKGEYQ